MRAKLAFGILVVGAAIYASASGLFLLGQSRLGSARARGAAVEGR